MLSAILSLVAIAGAIILIFKHNVNDTSPASDFVDIKTKNDFFRSFTFSVSLLIFLGSGMVLFRFAREFNDLKAMDGMLSTNFFSYFAAIVVSFMMFVSAQIKTDSEHVSSKKIHFMILIIAGLFLILVTTNILIISAILLMLAIIALHIMDAGTDKILCKNSLKVFIVRLLGACLFLIAALFTHYAIYSSSAMYLFVIGFFLLLPIFPASVFEADLTSQQNLKISIISIQYQFCVLYLFISIFERFTYKSLVFPKVFIILTIVSMIISLLIALSQKTLIRQFAYFKVFFSSFVMFSMLTAFDPTQILPSMKYFTLSLPLILTFYFLSATSLRASAIAKTTYFASISLLIGVPFTPFFNVFVDVTQHLMTFDLSYSTSQGTVYVLCFFASLMLLIYTLCNNLIKLKNATIHEFLGEKAEISTNMSRISMIILISVLILVFLLSILPVFFFQQLR